MAPQLGYWALRGIAEPIRYLLHYTGTEFEDKRYEFGPAPDYIKEWLKEKYTLDLDFPNLPYYIDGKVKITQSTAILRYLARKHCLTATTEDDITKQDMVEQQAVDLRTNLVRHAYFTFDTHKDEYIENLPNQLKPFSEFLGDNQWLLGDKLTYVDFLAYESLDFQRLLVSDCLDQFPNLKQYLERFENLPAISKYMKSKMFVKWPILSPLAKFGGK